MKFFFKDFYSNCESLLLKKSLMENFIICAVLLFEKIDHMFVL